MSALLTRTIDIVMVDVLIISTYCECMWYKISMKCQSIVSAHMYVYLCTILDNGIFSDNDYIL